MSYARVAFCLSGALAWCGSAMAEVRALEAFVQSQVLQNLADGTVDSIRSFEALDQTTPNLPLQVQAHLEKADSITGELSSATSTCTFNDPRSSLDENPKEFATDAVMFSYSSEATYAATSQAGETRTIAFTESEIGAANGTELLVTSHLYLDGYLAIWGDLTFSAVDPSSALVYVRIEQTRPHDANSTVVLETTIALKHDSAGEPILTATGAVGLDNLLPPGGDLSDVISVGYIHMARIPELSIPYQYSAVVGEEFTLTAEIQCRVSNQPFMGVGVSIGKSLEDFVAAISDTLPTPMSTISLSTLTKGSARLPAKPLENGSDTKVEIVGSRNPLTGFGPACGGLGMEAFLAGCMPVLFCLNRRRIS